MPPQRNYPMWSGAFWNSKERERRDNAAADADLKRQMILDEFIAGIANKAAMERLDKQEAGDTAREKMRLDRQDIWHLRDAGVSNDNARMMAEQRAAEDEAERAWRAQAAKDELARRRAADAMDWTNEAARQAQRRIEFSAEQDYKNKLLPYQKAEAISRLGQSIYATDQAGYELEPEIAAEYGWRLRGDTKLGQPGAAIKAPTRPVFKSTTAKPIKVDHSVANDATNVPMPPDVNGERKSSGVGGEAASTNLPGGLDIRNFIEALGNKSLKPR